MDDSKLEKAIVYAKSGSFHLAKPLLLGIVREDPTKEEAWFYLALCEKDEQLKINYLQVANKINPLSVPIRKYYQESVSRIKNKGTSTNAIGLQETLDSLVLEDDVYKNDNLRIPSLDIQTLGKKNSSDDEEKSFESHNKYTVTFSKAIYLTGTIIHYSDQPCCLRLIDEIGTESISCDECDHYSTYDCPFNDDCLFEDVRSVFRVIEKNQIDLASRSLEVATIIYKELRAHGLPLHHSVIANIVIGRNPKLNLTNEEVYEFMLMYPEMIERVGEGIYQAKGQ